MISPLSISGISTSLNDQQRNKNKQLPLPPKRFVCLTRDTGTLRIQDLRIQGVGIQISGYRDTRDAENRDLGTIWIQTLGIQGHSGYRISGCRDTWDTWSRDTGKFKDTGSQES